MNKIGLKEMNQYLSTKNEKELKDEIKELFKLFPEVKEFYQLKISPENEIDILERYRKLIKNEFWQKEPKLRYSVMKKAISDFKKIATQPENVADLMLSCVEYGVDFTNTYGDIDAGFYNSIYGIHCTALSFIADHDLETKFQERCKRIMNESDGIGWGFGDEMVTVYYEFFSDFEDEEIEE